MFGFQIRTPLSLLQKVLPSRQDFTCRVDAADSLTGQQFILRLSEAQSYQALILIILATFPVVSLSTIASLLLSTNITRPLASLAT